MNMPTKELAYREDWPEAADRLSRWWEGEYLGRPAMSVMAPRDGAVRENLPQAPNLWEHWTNPDYVIARDEQTARCTAWLGEACPQTWLNLGPVSMAGYLGTTIRPMPDTVWQGPIVDDWRDCDPVHDPDNEWWLITKRLASALSEHAEGKWFIASADLGDPGDVMSYLRGPERLCIDLIEGPREKMGQIRDKLVDLLCFYYDEIVDIVARHMVGTSSWLAVWSPKRTSTLQCDFSYMISPTMFDEFFAPAIAELTRRLDHVVYHLDGVGAIGHLDTLLSMPRLHAIQWVPGAGEESQAHPRWRPMLRRIIDAGVRVHLSVAPGEIEDLLREVPAHGLYLSTVCASEQDGRELLKQAEKWSRT